MLPLHRLALTATLLLITGTTTSAQERLRWKFEEGDTTNYRIVQDMDMKMSVMGQNVDTTMSQTMDMGWTVESVDGDGNAKLRQKISRVQMKMKNAFLNVEYDSSKEEQPDDPVGGQLAQVFGAMVGKDFSMTMTPLGEVKDVTIPEELQQALDGAGGGALAGGAFNSDSLKQLATQSSIAFPEDAVAKGKDWSGKTEAKLPFGLMKMDNQFTYQGTEQRGGQALHKIALKPQIAIEPDPNSQIQLSVKSQDGGGTIYFNNREGRIAESTMKQKMEMEITAGGMAITQSIDQTMTMKLLPKEE
jgi:hypothetical protein